MSTTIRSRVERIIELLKAQDESLLSWEKFFPDEYAKAVSEIRKSNLYLIKEKASPD